MAYDFDRMGEFAYDVLREVGNIGSGHAVTALSELLNKEVQMNVPRVQIVEFDGVSDIIGGPEMVVVGIYLRVHGEISGNMFFLLTVESAKELMRSLLGQSVSETEFSELERSALQEVGNILVGSYVTALADLTASELLPSPPGIAVDMAAAIMNVGFIQLGEVADVALVMNTEFLQGATEMEGHFLFIPDPGSVGRLFSALGVKIPEW